MRWLGWLLHDGAGEAWDWSRFDALPDAEQRIALTRAIAANPMPVAAGDAHDPLLALTDAENAINTAFQSADR